MHFRSALVACLLVAAPIHTSASTLSFPMNVVGQDQDGVTLMPDADAFDVLASRSSVVLTGVPITSASVVDVELTRVHVAKPEGTLAVDGFMHPEPMDKGLTLWSGTVRGDVESDVFLAFSLSGSRGWIRTEGRRVDLFASAVDGVDWSKTWSKFVPVDPNAPNPRAGEFCQAEAIQKIEPRSSVVQPNSGGGSIHTSSAGFVPIYEAEIGVETDYQFYQLFNDLDAAQAYAVTLMGAVSDRYREQMGVIFTMPYLGLYTSNNDPWTEQEQGGDCIDVLYQFKGAWEFGNGPVSPTPDLYTMLSGASLGCGVAWLDVLCHDEYNFSVNGNLGGATIFPPAQGNPGNWDFEVVAHELGHNFGSPHTHSFCPTPLDECAPSGYFGSCQNQQNCINNGTVMSYCHLCSGGLNNMTLMFHPTVVSLIRNEVVNSCLNHYEGVTGTTDLGNALAGSNGTPGLTVSYDDQVSSLSIDVGQAPSSQPGLLIFSSTTAFAPLLGGILVPNLSIVVSIGTNGNGDFGATAPFPPTVHFARGATFYGQAWFNDPAGPNNFAATNGLEFELVIP